MATAPRQLATPVETASWQSEGVRRPWRGCPEVPRVPASVSCPPSRCCPPHVLPRLLPSTEALSSPYPPPTPPCGPGSKLVLSSAPRGSGALRVLPPLTPGGTQSCRPECSVRGTRGTASPAPPPRWWASPGVLARHPEACPPSQSCWILVAGGGWGAGELSF